MDKTNGNLPIVPTGLECGLTKREYIAGLCMASFAGIQSKELVTHDYATASVEWADAVLAALEADNA